MSMLWPSRWPIIIATAACLGASSRLIAQAASVAPVILGDRDFDVLRDVVGQQWSAYKGMDSQLCLDPTVASYRASVSTTRERWSTDIVSRLAGTVRISLDTLTADLPRGIRGCTRSQTTWRVAYGRPRVFPDSAAIVFIGTRLDSRGGVDSLKVDFRLERKAGKWSVEGWLADSQTVHRYVKGEGCYRLWYAPLETPGPSRTRIDTTELTAESTFVGQSWQTFPAYRLSMGPRFMGIAAQQWSNSTWYVTHDSLHFEWSRLNEMMVADLLVFGDTVRGTMHSETDAIVSNPPTTSVQGRRIPCGTARKPLNRN